MKALLLTYLTLIGFLAFNTSIQAAAAGGSCNKLSASDSETTLNYLLKAGTTEQKAVARTPYDACMELRNECLSNSQCPGGGNSAKEFCECLNQNKGNITCYTEWDTGDGGAPGICRVLERSPNGTGLPSGYCPKKVDGNAFPTCDHLKPKKASVSTTPAAK